MGGPDRRGARSGGRAREPDRQRGRQPVARREGGAARAARVRRSQPVPARTLRAGKRRHRRACRADDAGRRRTQVRARRDAECGAGLGGRARGVEPVSAEDQPGSAPARPGQGGGAHRGRFPDPALLRTFARQPFRHPREPGGAARAPAAVLFGRHHRLHAGDAAHRTRRRRGGIRPQRVRPPRAPRR